MRPSRTTIRVLHILQFLSIYSNGLSANELSMLTQIPKSSVYDILLGMIEDDAVCKFKDKYIKYRLSINVQKLGVRFFYDHMLLQYLQPYFDYIDEKKIGLAMGVMIDGIIRYQYRNAWSCQENQLMSLAPFEDTLINQVIEKYNSNEMSLIKVKGYLIEKDRFCMPIQYKGIAIAAIELEGVTEENVEIICETSQSMFLATKKLEETFLYEELYGGNA